MAPNDQNGATFERRERNESASADAGRAASAHADVRPTRCGLHAGPSIESEPEKLETLD